MSYNEADAEVLIHVARRLSAEGLRLFRYAHELALRSSDALSADVQLKQFGEAVELERRAIDKQGEAIELRRLAERLRAAGLARLKEALVSAAP